MVEQKLPKLKTRVRFPSPAPIAQWPSAAGNQFRCVEKATQRLNSLQVVPKKTALGLNGCSGFGFKSGCFAFPDDIGNPDITTDRQRSAVSTRPIRAYPGIFAAGWLSGVRFSAVLFMRLAVSP